MSYHFPNFVRPVPSLSVILAAIAFASLFATSSMAQHRALIITIDKYAVSSLGDLPSGLAKNNSEAIKKLLTEKFDYKPENIKVLQNEQATRPAIIEAITDWLGPERNEKVASVQLKGLDQSGALNKKSKRKKKRVRRKRKKNPKSYKSFLYFAGFGLAKSDNDSKSFGISLVPYDASIAPINDKKHIKGSISGDDLQDAIAKFIRRRTTVVFDTKYLEYTPADLISETRVNSQPELRPLAGSIGRIKRVSAPAPKREASKTGARMISWKVTLWQAALPGQMALAAGSEENPIGLFTSAFVRAIVEAEADTNANGIISNAEVLHYVSDRSSAYCSVYKERCAAGLKPLLRPVRAFGRSAWVDRSKVKRGRERRLTLARLGDFLGVPEKGDISLRQDPPSPLKVGADNIHYEVTSTTAGHLILLNLTAGGSLFQLYPNQYAGQDENGLAGRLEAEKPLKVPEESYGVSFSATVPAKGHIIAILAPGQVKFDASVNARTIALISPREAIRVYLAELAAALNKSATHQARWSVVTLPYEILP